MKALRSIVVAAVLLAVAGVVLAGVRSSDGRQIVTPLGDSAQATGRSLTSGVGFGALAELAGNAWAATAIGAALALAALLLLPAAGAGWGRRVAVAAAVGVGVLVYHPQFIGGAA